MTMNRQAKSMTDFTYPMLTNFASFEEVDDEWVRVTDWFTGRSYNINKVNVEFAKKLDGNTDPYSIPTKLSREEVVWTVAILDEIGLLRRSSVLENASGESYSTFWIPSMTAKLKRLARIYTRLLNILWLPLLVLGFVLFGYFLPTEGDFGVMAIGIILGEISGVILHEIGHALAGIACGAHVYESGLKLSGILPITYTLMDTDALESKERVSILSAGIRSNLLLVGVSFLIACAIPKIGMMMFGIAFWNLIIAVFNMIFDTGLDGRLIIAEYLGIKDVDKFVRKVFHSRKFRKSLRKKGPTGYALMVILAILRLFQFFLLLIPVGGILYLVESIFFK
ncbi:MAG: hypothetical protein LUF29_03085 [Oscillospiraceae bacterium]|nr:hypothetical protein [Oscillospiraceae bacterium]